MKYKVGDKVRVRSRAWWDKQPKDSDGDYRVNTDCGGELYFVDYMKAWCGKTVTIKEVRERDSFYKLEEDLKEWEWCDGMFEPAYTYAELDLPDWWDGRPILGYVSDISEEHARQSKTKWWIWPNFFSKDNVRFVATMADKVSPTCKMLFKYFVPAEQESRKVCITVKENGESKEIELTEAQIKQLGL